MAYKNVETPQAKKIKGTNHFKKKQLAPRSEKSSTNHITWLTGRA